MYEPLQRKPGRKQSDWKAAHDATQRALKARKGLGTDADRPPPSTFPGRKATVLYGQLSLTTGEGVIHEMNERRATGGASQRENAGDPVP